MLSRRDRDAGCARLLRGQRGSGILLWSICASQELLGSEAWHG